MAGFASFTNGLLDGMRTGSGMVRDAYNTQAQVQRNANIQRDYEEQRQLKDGRKSATEQAIAEGTQPARAGDEGPVPEKRRPVWESLESAAQKRLSAGDLDGYEALTSKSTALKSLHFGTALNQAALTRDPSQIASVMNQLNPDYKFDARLGEDGSVVGTVAGPDGKKMPLVFKDVDDMATATKAFISNGSVSASLQETAKARADIALRGAQTNQAQAQAGFIGANTKTENDTRPAKVDEGVARVGLVEAQTANQTAAASKTATDRLTPVEQQYQGLIKIGIDPETARAHVMGKGDRAQSREKLITDVATKLIDASSKVIGGTPLGQEEALKQAAALVDGAAQAGGTSKVGSGPGMRVPGAPGAAPAKGAGTGGKAPAGMDASESRRASEIKAAVKAGTMTRADALTELKALGFQ